VGTAEGDEDGIFVGVRLGATEGLADGRLLGMDDTDGRLLGMNDIVG